MTKFGITLKKEISLTISRESFEEFISPFLEADISGEKNWQYQIWNVLMLHSWAEEYH